MAPDMENTNSQDVRYNSKFRVILPLFRKNKNPNRQKSTLKREDNIVGLLFVLPPFIGIIIFVLVPLVMSLYSSFTSWNGMIALLDARVVQFANFKRMFDDPIFYKALYNTVFMMLGIPIGLFLSILLALGMNSKIPGREAFRVLYYIPVISSIIAVTLLFQNLFHNDGIINDIIAFFGFPRVRWFQDATNVKIALTIFMVWKGLGYSTLLYLAGLQGVPKSYYEAAKLDGASDFQAFRKITLPLLYPVTFFMVITGLIGGFQVFTEPRVMVGNGPGNGAVTIVTYLYDKFALYRQVGYASAVSWVLAVIIFVITAIQFYVNHRRSLR